MSDVKGGVFSALNKCGPLQGPPRHRLASARADFDPQDPCHIICKGSCQEDA